MSFALEPADLAELERIGISEDQALSQLARLARGTQYLHLDRPATLGDGIEVLDPAQRDRRQQAFKDGLERVTRFVPASGAASRMFADLLAGLSSEGTADAPESQRPFFDQQWPFQAAIDRAMPTDQNNRSTTDRERALRTLLLGTQTSAESDVTAEPGQAGLSRLPKALIPFHREGDREVTALEEQVEEAVELAGLGGARNVRLHFTVSSNHQKWIEALAEKTRHRHRDQVAIEITTSTQARSTDTLAIDAQHQPLRRPTEPGGSGDGTGLVLRPGGHGALLHNLQACDSDLVLIKNIDNVQPKAQRSITIQWKASLLGALVLAQNEVFEATEALARPSDAAVARATTLLARFGRKPPTSDAADLRAELNRPIRLCGVVRNTGEPGGGPFWVETSQGDCSLQIVEGAQIDPDSADQQAILHRSTHFNPVDLACGLRDYRGQPFDLNQYRDDDTYFVAHKTFDAQSIRALEHPGLWNGAMAHWLTLFVEAPAATFTPVKTVWDLLRPQHQ